MATIVGTYTADVPTITAGKQLGFKLGLESKLTSASFAAVEGVFYLTSDTHRLFIGNKDGNVCPVNQGVIQVDSLPEGANAIPGQFYYIKGSNVLATRSGNAWVQINPDTYVDSVSETVTGGTNNAKVTTSVKHGGGKGNTITSAGFTVKGGGSNVVTVSGSEITITDADFGLSATGDNDNGIDINLMTTAAGGTTESVKDKVTFKSGTGIKLTRNGDEITIDGSALSNTASENNITGAAIDSQADGFKLTLTKGSGSSVTAEVKPTITYGTNDIEAKFVNGIADLDVYTQEETDSKINAALRNFDALKYMGTVGGTGATIANLTNASDVERGHVYMATGSAQINVNGVTGPYDAGTLFIATGEENTTTGIIANPTWTVVSNFNTDTKTDVELLTNGIKLVNKTSDTNVEIGGITVNSGTADILSVTSKASETDSKKIQNVTIAHGVSSYEATKASAYSQKTTDLMSMKVLTDVGADGYGHLKSSKEEWVIVPGEVFADASVTDSVTVNGSVATLSHTLTLKNSSTTSKVTETTVNTQIASETLEIKESNGALAMNLIWGSFE